MPDHLSTPFPPEWREIADHFMAMRFRYQSALREVQTKLEILSTEFNLKHKRNPISSIHTRLKRTESIMEKLMKNDLPLTIDSIEKNIHDVAGIRVICSYIDDIYSIAEALLKQDDVTLIARKDYIENPKPNGYRSLHLIISVPVFLADTKKEVKVEVKLPSGVDQNLAMAIYLDGEKVKSVTVNPIVTDAYYITLAGTGTSALRVYINDNPYMDYSVNFDTGTSTITTSYEFTPPTTTTTTTTTTEATTEGTTVSTDVASGSDAA